jgi:hypothetical protein
MNRSKIAPSLKALVGLATVLVGGSRASAGEAPTTKPSAALPPISVVRYDEDYSFLRDTSRRSDLFDPIKYIPFNQNGDAYLSLGGSMRERYEYFHNINGGTPPQDANGYYLTRFLAHADLHLGDNFRIFAQLKSSMEDGRDGGPRPSDSDEFDIQQAFFDLRLPLGGTTRDAITFRGGRQELAYGAERLIGVSDWSNVLRTFEGGRAMLATGNNRLDLFWVRPVVISSEEPNVGDGNTSFAGIYDTLALPSVLQGAKLELYGLALNKTKGAAYDTAGAVGVDSDTYTLGVRFSGKPAPFDFDAELDYQFGQYNHGDLNAYSVSLVGGYTMTAVLTPRIFVGFDYASGDNDRADADRQTFNQLFPTGHMYLGYIDMVGRQNIIDIHPGVDFTLCKDRPNVKSLTLRAEYHQFWRASTDDAVYNAAGGITRAAVAGHDERGIGGELDLLLTWQVDRHLALCAGYSHLWSGAFLRNTGPGKDVDFFYAWASYAF